MIKLKVDHNLRGIKNYFCSSEHQTLGPTQIFVESRCGGDSKSRLQSKLGLQMAECPEAL